MLHGSETIWSLCRRNEVWRELCRKDYEISIRYQYERGGKDMKIIVIRLPRFLARLFLGRKE